MARLTKNPTGKDTNNGREAEETGTSKDTINQRLRLNAGRKGKETMLQTTKRIIRHVRQMRGTITEVAGIEIHECSRNGRPGIKLVLPAGTKVTSKRLTLPQEKAYTST